MKWFEVGAQILLVLVAWLTSASAEWTWYFPEVIPEESTRSEIAISHP